MGTLRSSNKLLAAVMSSAIPGLCWRVLPILAVFCAASPLPAQDPGSGSPEEQVPLFSLLNLVKTDGPLTVKIGGEPVGIGEMPFGFFTGIVNWYPTMPVSLEAKGFEPSEIPLPDGARSAVSVPLFVVFDAKKPLRSGEQPVPVIEWAKIPTAANRSQTYLDVINLSSEDTLEAEAGGSKIALPKRKRVRVSNKAAASVRILPNGPDISISAPEGGGASQMLALVFSKPDGSMDYAVASEPDVQR